MPRGVAAQPRYHDTITRPFPAWPGGMRVVLTDEGPLGALQSYMLSLDEQPSITTQSKLCVSVGRLYDYFRAEPPEAGSDPVEFMSRFARAVKRGTIGPDGDDPLDLFWPPATRRQARQIIRHVTAFSDFCAKAAGLAPLNPTREATFRQRMTAFRQLAEKRKYDLLAHLGTPDEVRRRAEQARAVALPRLHRGLRKEPPFFPFDHTTALLQEGFRVRRTGAEWERYNVRDLMIVVLQRFGGVRASEALHLFARDIDGIWSRDLGAMTAGVTLVDPADGRTPYQDPLTGALVSGASRAQFLQTLYGRVPRSDPITPPGQSLGWKSMLMEDMAALHSKVHWFPQEWGIYFWRLYEQYVRHVLPRRLDHPYLFVVTKPGADYGKPLSLGAYYESIERAVGRIGLTSAKDLGTTSHGLRHAYAQSLRRTGVGRKLRQVFMHHVSPESQDTYIAPSASELAGALSSARRRIERGDLGEDKLLQARAALVLPPGDQ